MLSCFGASVRGPDHQQHGLPNQDAWLLRTTATGSVAVVADGLGSARHAQLGARAACKAGEETARLVRRSGVAPTVHTIEVLRAIWHHLVAPTGIEHCGTTCLFALIDREGLLFVAQVGDGIVAIRRADRHVTILQANEKPFQNTTGTIASVAAEDWTAMCAIQLMPGDTLLMATDGIADDLEMSRLGDFIGHLSAEYLPMPAIKRAAAMRRALVHWPTKHHRDDKTLVVIARTM